MAKAATLPPDEGAETNETRPNDEQLGSRVLAILGRPPELLRMSVFKLWTNHYRVNVLTGPDTATVRIAHSYFVQTTGAGEIVMSTPSLTRVYK